LQQKSLYAVQALFIVRSVSACGPIEKGDIPHPDAGSFLHRQKGTKNWLWFRPDGFRHTPAAFRARTPDPIIYGGVSLWCVLLSPALAILN